MEIYLYDATLVAMQMGTDIGEASLRIQQWMDYYFLNVMKHWLLWRQEQAWVKHLYEDTTLDET